MDEKKKKDEHEFVTSVDCPVHGKPLQVQTENRVIDGKTTIVKFAVCKCMVPDNTHYGQRVWEQS